MIGCHVALRAIVLVEKTETPENNRQSLRPHVHQGGWLFYQGNRAEGAGPHEHLNVMRLSFPSQAVVTQSEVRSSANHR